MSWWAVDVSTGPEHRDDVAVWLVAATGHAVEERGDGTLVGFAATAAEAGMVADGAASRFQPVATRIREVAVIDWATRWRDGIGIRRIGRLALCPSWLEPPPDVEAVVVVDPESAFGSGEHGSTRSALRLLVDLVRPGDRVLDLGTGSGILAIAAARLGARSAVGIEIDTTALPVATRNVDRNGVSGCVRILEGDAADLAPLLGPVDVVVSNILRTANVSLLPAILRSLAPRGVAILAGMEAAEAPLFLPVLTAHGFAVEREGSDDGWWSVAARVT